jgi:Holliday junction resolvase RusA-like endonuclease
MSERITEINIEDLALSKKPLIEFFVQGIPAPGGSKKIIPRCRYIGQMVRITNKLLMQSVFITDDAKGNKTWRNKVSRIARAHWGPRDLLDEALSVYMCFYLPRPLGHFGTGKNAGTIKKSARLYPTVKPDVLKLARSTEDALTGVIYKDDAATIDLVLGKLYVDSDDDAGCKVAIFQKPEFLEKPQRELF